MSNLTRANRATAALPHCISHFYLYTLETNRATGAHTSYIVYPIDFSTFIQPMGPCLSPPLLLCPCISPFFSISLSLEDRSISHQ